MDGERVLRVRGIRWKKSAENVQRHPNLTETAGYRRLGRNLGRQPEVDNVRAAGRRRDVLGDGIVANSEERLKIARMRRIKGTLPTTSLSVPDTVQPLKSPVSNPPLVIRFALAD